LKPSRKLDIGIALFLLLLPLLWFAPQALGGKTLIPADNLFASEPWRSYAAQQGVGVPHNLLISDMVLENRPWKSLIVEALRSGDLEGILWNPRIFTGVPFLAAGQHSALYPLSILFYLLPLWRAYGVFTWLQLGLAALGMYVFARVLGQRRPAAMFAAIAYAFSGFFIVSVNFTMIIAAAAWLPWILTLMEIVVRQTEQVGISTPRRRRSPAPFVIAGAVALGPEVLAGHVEITYYTLIVCAFYAIWRLAALGLRLHRWRPVLRLAGWLAVMVVLGLALGAAQLLPLYELVRQSFREGAASLQQVRDWAWPSQQILTFLLPDFFGNPTSHSYFDIWQRAWVPVTQNALGGPLNTIDWGVKNYVEGGNYVGIVTLLLAGVGMSGIGYWVFARRKSSIPNIQYLVFFAVLAVLSLLFAFGTPLYAVLYYLLPGYSQLHSAFRWVFPYTLSIAVLAGYGLDTILNANYRLKIQNSPGLNRQSSIFNLQSSIFNPQSLIRLFGGLAALVGAGALAVVLASVVTPRPFVALGDKLLAWSFWADRAQSTGFANGAMLWSYEATGLARFGAMAFLAGVALMWATRGRGDAETKFAASPRHPVTVSPHHRVSVSPRLPIAVSPRHPVTVSPHQRVSASPRLPIAASPRHLVAVSFLVLLILDLWLFGHNFNTAADPKLLDFKPPVIDWLQSKQDPTQPWRLTSFDSPGDKDTPPDKTLNANAAMPYGLEDVRGYDSIISKSYVAFMQRIQPQGDLLYNRIAPIYTQVNGRPNYDALDSRLLDLLGVRYVVTTHTIPNAGYDLVYDREVKVYQNKDALPRAFIVPEAVAAADQTAALDLLERLDPAQKVVIEGLAPGQMPPPASPQLREARIGHSTNRELFVDVNISDRGWLVLTDASSDGWKAYLRPFGVEGEGVTATGESVEEQLPLYRADGAFQAVYLPKAGQWTVRFVYSPRSFLLGAYTSFLAVMTLLLLAGWWAWGRFYKGEHSEVGTVAKNSAVQMILSLVNKGIDFAFAMLRLRVLSPAGEGSYAFAIAFYGIFEIVTRYGLGTLLTRDVALDKRQARRYLGNVVTLRTGLWLISLPIMALVCVFYRVFLHQLTAAEAQAIALFAAALLFANIADALSSVFFAFEKMEYPAGISTAISVAKVALGALILLPPLELGFVGLAGVSLVMNVVQVIWLYVVLHEKVLAAERYRDTETRRHGEEGQRAESPAPRFAASPRQAIDWNLQRYMLRESGPLMINHLLATIFWRISQFVLRGAANPASLGIFSAAVKYIDGLNVIPAYFTLAIFPLMSRYAAAGKDALIKAYRLAVQLLFIVSLPIAVFFSFAATPMIRILGGAAYLPDSATALSVMIWSIPIGFINSVTQYVLIAVNQQRFLTRAFLIGVAFTAAANLLLVPRYGYLAAAIIQIPAELALFIPFYWAVRRHVAVMPWTKLLGGPIVAAGLNAAVVWALGRIDVPLFAALAAGFAVYCGTLVLLGTFRNDDFVPLRERLLRWVRRS